MMNLKSSGVQRYNMEMINELIQTDLPCPVAPAIKQCGILAKSWITGLLVTLSTPKTTGISIVDSVQAFDWIISRSKTSLRC